MPGGVSLQPSGGPGTPTDAVHPRCLLTAVRSLSSSWCCWPAGRRRVKVGSAIAAPSTARLRPHCPSPLCPSPHCPSPHGPSTARPVDRVPWPTARGPHALAEPSRARSGVPGRAPGESPCSSGSRTGKCRQLVSACGNPRDDFGSAGSVGVVICPGNVDLTGVRRKTSQRHSTPKRPGSDCEPHQISAAAVRIVDMAVTSQQRTTFGKVAAKERPAGLQRAGEHRTTGPKSVGCGAFGTFGTIARMSQTGQ